MHKWGDRGKYEGQDVDTLGREKYDSDDMRDLEEYLSRPLRVVIEDTLGDG